MNNRQLLALSKKCVRLPQKWTTDKATGEKALSAYFIANPNAYVRADKAREELSEFGF